MRVGISMTVKVNTPLYHYISVVEVRQKRIGNAKTLAENSADLLYTGEMDFW